MDPNYVRDEENEDEIMRGIYEDANRYDPDGEDAGGEDVGGGTDAGGEDDEDFTSQFLMDSGEGLLDEEEITPATSNTLHLEVYIWILYFVDHKMH